MTWIMSHDPYGPFYIDHILWTISYGPYHMDHIIWTMKWTISTVEFWDFHKVNCFGACVSWGFLFAIYLEYPWFDRCSWCYSRSCSCWRCTRSRLWGRTHLGTDSPVWIITRWWGQSRSWCRFYQNIESFPGAKATKERSKNSKGRFIMHNYLTEVSYVSLLLSLPSIVTVDSVK